MLYLSPLVTHQLAAKERNIILLDKGSHSQCSLLVFCVFLYAFLYAVFFHFMALQRGICRVCSAVAMFLYYQEKNQKGAALLPLHPFVQF